MISDEEYLKAVGACFWASPKMGIKLKAAIEKHASYLGKHRHRYFDAYPAIMSYVLWLREHAPAAETKERCSKIISDHLGGIKPLAAQPAGEWQMAPYFGWLADFRPEIAKKLLADFKPATKSAPPVPEFRQVPPQQRFVDWIEVRNHRYRHYAEAIAVAEPAADDLQPALRWPDLDQLDRGRLAGVVRDVFVRLLKRRWLRAGILGAVGILLFAVVAPVVFIEWRNEARADAARSARMSEVIQELANDPATDQVRSLEDRLADDPGSQERAEIASQLGVLNAFLGRPEALDRASHAVERNPNNPKWLMRLASLEALSLDDSDVAATINDIEALDRRGEDADTFLRVAWVLRREGWYDLAIAVDDLDRLWRDISSIQDDITREILMIVASAKYARAMDDFRFTRAYLAFTNDCGDLSNAVFITDCALLYSLNAEAEHHEEDATTFLTPISAQAWKDGEIESYIALELERARITHFATRDGFSEAVRIAENVLDDARMLGDRRLLYATLSSLFSFHRDYPSFNIQAALPYGREAFEIGEGNPADPLFSTSNFLERYADLEAEIGDPQITDRIYTHLLATYPADGVFQQIGLAILTARYAGFVEQQGDAARAAELSARAGEIAMKAVDDIPPAEPITAESHPRSRAVERYRVGVLNQLQNTGFYQVKDRIFADQQRELETLPEEIHAEHADYHRQVDINRLDNILESYRYDRRTIPDPDEFAAGVDSLIEDTRSGRAEGSFSVLTERMLDTFEIKYAGLFQSNDARLAAIADAWTHRLRFVLDTIQMEEAAFRTSIPDMGAIDSRGMEVAKRDWLSAHPDQRAANNLSWLAEFVGRYAASMSSLENREDAKLAAFLSYAYAEHAGYDEHIRDRYLAAATIYKGLSDNAFAENDVSYISYLSVGSVLAEVWLSGVQQSRDLRSEGHLAMLSLAMSGNILRREFDMARSHLAEFERISAELGRDCLDCTASRRTIAESELAYGNAP